MSQSKETFMSDREREANGLPLIYAGMSKTDIAIAAKTAVDNLLDSGNTLAIAEQVAAMESFLKEVKGDDRYTKAVREEVEKYGKVHQTGSGAKIELAEVSVSYDYSNDLKWVELNAAAETAVKALKDHEELLKKIPAGKVLVDEETGETLTGPSKTSKSGFKIQLAK